MKLSQIEQRDQFIGLFLGESGSGKSVAMASWAEEGPIELHDLDRRAAGILGAKKFLSAELMDKIDIHQFTVKEGFIALNKRYELYDIYAATNKLPFRTHVTESIATLQKWLILDSMANRGIDKSKNRGAVLFPSPDDYNYASVVLMKIIYQVLMPLRANIIMSGWVVDEYGKAPGDNNPYSRDVVIGKKLLGTNKWGAEIPGYFDEIYFFEKEEVTGSPNGPVKFTVTFEGGLAKTSRSQLKGLQKIDITNKSFYQTYQKLLKGKDI